MSRDVDLQVIALVACAFCGAAVGTQCIEGSSFRLMVHFERRHAWQAQRPRSAELADIVMSDQRERLNARSRWRAYVLLAPLTARGRLALPNGLTRVEHCEMRQTLQDLRGQGLIVMREE